MMITNCLHVVLGQFKLSTQYLLCNLLQRQCNVLLASNCVQGLKQYGYTIIITLNF